MTNYLLRNSELSNYKSVLLLSPAILIETIEGGYRCEKDINFSTRILICRFACSYRLDGQPIREE